MNYKILLIVIVIVILIIIYKYKYGRAFNYSESFLNEQATNDSYNKIMKDYTYEIRKDFDTFKTKWANEYYAKNPDTRYLPLNYLEKQINDGTSEEFFNKFRDDFTAEGVINKDIVDTLIPPLLNWRDINCKGEDIEYEGKKANTCDSMFGFYEIARYERIKL